MSLMSVIKRYTTARGRDDRALLRGVLAWNERQLIPVAPERMFSVKVPLPGDANGVECNFTTIGATTGGIAVVKVEVRRACCDRLCFTVIFREQNGQPLTVVWP